MRTKEENIQLIKSLSNARGVSGFEDEVVALCRKEMNPQYNLEEDTLRNLYFSKKDNSNAKPKVWLDAHTDEVGFIVQYLKNNGTMGFLPVGGWSPATIGASKVAIKNNDGAYVTGVVAAKPPHFMSESERGKGPTIEQMVIDVGAVSKKELTDDFNLSVAAPVVPDVTCEYVATKEVFIGKAFDCRIGVAALMETLNQLTGETLDVDIVGTFTAQEEVGLRGAKAAVSKLDADVAIVFEGAPADDTFYGEEQIQTGLKRGPMLRHFDVSMINNPRFMRHAINLAKKLEIPLQEAVRSGGGTNGGAIHLSKNGIPTIVISVPVRYVHAHHGICAYEDYLAAIKLAKAVVSSLNADIIGGF